MPTRSATKDPDAAELVRKLMVEHGHTPRSLSAAIKAKGVRAGFPPHRVKVSPDTLWLIFSTQRQPGPRIKWAIAFYFDLKPGQIWSADAIDFPHVPSVPVAA